MKIQMDKYQKIQALIGESHRVIVAYSGGIDSSLLLKVAIDTLGRENVMAITCRSPLMADADIDSAINTASEINAIHRIIDTPDLHNPSIVSNTPERCFYCKRCKMETMVGIAQKEGYDLVLEGSNLSDSSDYRPGMKAVRMFSEVASPFVSIGFEKHEIRTLARIVGLQNWDLPARGCLATRIPYGDEITLEKLQQVEQAEARLSKLGYKSPRVRHHGTVARVELSREDMEGLLSLDSLGLISAIVKSCGFIHAAIDADGYRTGSLDEVLPYLG